MEEGNDPQILRVIVTIFNKQSWTVVKGWSHSWNWLRTNSIVHKNVMLHVRKATEKICSCTYNSAFLDSVKGGNSTIN